MLGKIALYSDYIDKEDKKKGFFVYYTGGDFCGGDFSLERKTKFVFNCDQEVEFEVKSVSEPDRCIY